MPELIIQPETVRVPRETVSSRLLDSSMTEADKDFLRTAVVRNQSRGIDFRNSKRLRKLLQLETEAKVGA